MSKATKLLAILSVTVGGWIVWGWFSAHTVNELTYTVLEKHDEYEVRQYDAYLVAQIAVPGPWSQAYSKGFRAVSAYTSGDNTTQTSIALNASVGFQQKAESEDIGHRVPVISEMKNGQWFISSVLPDKYSLYTIPRPNNPEIRLIEIPVQKVAVLRFGGGVDQEKSQAQQMVLENLLKRDKATILSSFRLAQYNMPWTPPFLRRNEILVTIL